MRASVNFRSRSGSGAIAEHGQCVGVAELGKGHEGAWVVLAQGTAQGVRLSLPGPDEVLVGPREDLDGAMQLAVGRDLTVVLAVGAHEISEHPRVTVVGLGPAHRVALAVAGRGQRIDRIDRIAGGHESTDEQAPVGLDADDHVGRSLGVLPDPGVESGTPSRPSGMRQLMSASPSLSSRHTS